MQANDKNSNAEQQKQAELIAETGSVTIDTGRNNIHCLTIVGQVEGHQILPPNNKTTKYEHVMPQLAAIEESSDIDGLLILLNTVGGDIEAGLAIAELIAGMHKPTVSLILGGGHSIGVPLAVAAKKCFIASTASMTLHPVRLNGTILGVPQTLTYFEKIQERIINFIVENSRVQADVLRGLMLKTGELLNDVGSVVYGKDAVELGLCDSLGSLHDALQCLHGMIEEGRA